MDMNMKPIILQRKEITMDKSFKIKLGKDVYTDKDLDTIFELAQAALNIINPKNDPLKSLRAKLDRTLA